MSRAKAMLLKSEILARIQIFDDITIDTIITYLDFEETKLIPCDRKAESYIKDKTIIFPFHWARLETCQDQRVKHNCSEYNDRCVIVIDDSKNIKINNNKAFRICMSNHRIYKELNLKQSSNFTLTSYYDEKLFCPYYTTPCFQCNGTQRVKCATKDHSCGYCHGFGFTRKWGGEYIGYIRQEGKCYYCSGTGKKSCVFCTNGTIACGKCYHGFDPRLVASKKSRDCCLIL